MTLRYEAAVGGAIPIIRLLDDALAGDRVRAIAGVFNGTCTSILSSMEDGTSYSRALVRAQELGYAEADPSEDVDGIDAAHKSPCYTSHSASQWRRHGFGAKALRESLMRTSLWRDRPDFGFD